MVSFQIPSSQHCEESHIFLVIKKNYNIAYNLKLKQNKTTKLKIEKRFWFFKI